MRRTALKIIEAFLGVNDSDSVTRRIRRTIVRYRNTPSQQQRGRIVELVNAIGGRDSAHDSIRQLALRRTRS